jgi:dihydropyrimidinase
MNKNTTYKCIRNGTVITAADCFVGDILIADRAILAIGQNLDVPINTEETDASGLYVFPGAIDVHTHLDLPFMGTSSADDFSSGTKAAVFGGTTSIIDFAIQTPGQSLYSALQRWKEKAEGKAVIDFGFHMAITDFNDATAAEIPQLILDGITSFKCFMAYKGALMVDDGQIFRIMTLAKQHGGIVTAHCENAELIEHLTKKHLVAQQTDPIYHELSHSAIGEGEATNRFISISRLVDHPAYVVHLTCNEALRHIKESTSIYQHPMFAETCPQYLLLDRSLYARPNFEGAKWVMSPPLRTNADQEALWAGLRDGYIQTIATDHCPFHFSSQKITGKGDFSKIPNGAPGIENRMNLIFSYGVLKNRISLNRFVQIMSTNPAKIFGLYPRKGTIAPGSDADIVLFDPHKENTISVQNSHHNCDYSAFEGWETTGAPISVLANGKWLLKNGVVQDTPPSGRFLKRNAFNKTESYVR